MKKKRYGFDFYGKMFGYFLFLFDLKLWAYPSINNHWFYLQIRVGMIITR